MPADAIATLGLRPREAMAKQSPERRHHSGQLLPVRAELAPACSCTQTTLGAALLGGVNEAFGSQFLAVFIILLQQMKALKPKGT